jgi:uncharacterized iron-regulated membrane protein
MNWWSRKLHRWGALLICIPLLLVIITGLMLQLKKQVPWVQPPTATGTSGDPSLGFDQILSATIAVSETEVRSWSDIERLDVQPGKGIVKVQCKNNWEVQLDLQTAEVRSSLYRRSDWIESLHDGSFFSQNAKLWIFLPSGFILLSLWITGAWLWWLPIQSRMRKRKRLAALEK